MSQTNLFDETMPPSSDDPLLGAKVKMPSLCRCGTDAAVVGAGTVTHRASVLCANCKRHRAWLSESTASWLLNVAGKFGAPPLITLRTKGRKP